jgi:hypothetical protein
LAWQRKFFNLPTVKKKRERTGIIKYQTGATQQQFAIIKTKRHNRMSPPNLPYNDTNLIYIDYNGMSRLPNLLHNRKKIPPPEVFPPSLKILHEGISKLGFITFPFSQIFVVLVVTKLIFQDHQRSRKITE